jgi:hypothetical protein
LTKTANRLGGYYILPTANRLGGSDYFYNRRLAVIVFITGGFKITFQLGSLVGFGPEFNFLKKDFNNFWTFAFWYKTLIIFE